MSERLTDPERLLVENEALLSAQKAQQESERKFREVVRNLDEGFYACSMDGLLLEHNVAFNRILGFEAAQDLRGSKLPDFWQDPEDRRAYLAELMSAGVVRNYLIQARTIQGAKLVVMASAHLVQDERGDPVRIEGIFTDFTERKRVEEALREANSTLERRVLERTAELARSKQFLEETGKLARVGGWEIDLVKNELSWTSAVYQIHELGPDFRPTVEAGINFYAPEAVPVISEAVRLAIAEGRPFDVELQLVTARKKRLWVRAVGEAVREDGKIVRVRGVFQDIDERKRYREHLEEMVAERTKDLAAAVESLARSNQELEQFAYVASHDLQEPLRMVSSYTQLLAQRYGDQLDQDAKDFIAYAVDGANRMQRLIQDLLVYSRVTTRGQALAPVDAHDALGEAVKNLQAAIQESGALVTSDELPRVLGDPTQIAQLLQNLIGNGLKFRKPGEPPRVHLSAAPSADQPGFWTFRVADNGIGIEPRHFGRLFVIFQRLHGKQEYPGTGIGLALCKRIVERHGGKIWLASEAGQGTTFFFTLPSADRGKGARP